MKGRKKIEGLLILVLVLGCYGDEGVDISVDVDGVKVSGLQNPCEFSSCPDGHTCSVVYHSGVLGVPVARCSPTDTQSSKESSDSAPCVQFKVGSNVMRCKTEKEWQRTGDVQCALRLGQGTPLLSNSKVEHTCHSFDSSSEPVFLQASFTCCPRLPSSITTTVREEAGFEGHVQTEVEEGDTKERHYIILYPAVIAMAIILATIFIVVAVWQRRCSRRQPKHPKLTIATSFINQSAQDEATPTYDVWDEYNGRSDKSFLVINEFTPGN